MNTISIALLGVGGIVLLFSLLQKNSNFLDIRFVFIQHFKVFKRNYLQLISIFLVPALFAIGIARIRCVDKDVLNNLNIVLSILTAMFFSILSILSTLTKENKSEKYQQLLKETFTSTLFEVILCLLLLVISFMALFIGNYEVSVVLTITSAVIYYLALVAILNILAIIKRIKVLFDN